MALAKNGGHTPLLYQPLLRIYACKQECREHHQRGNDPDRRPVSAGRRDQLPERHGTNKPTPLPGGIHRPGHGPGVLVSDIEAHRPRGGQHQVRHAEPKGRQHHNRSLILGQAHRHQQ